MLFPSLVAHLYQWQTVNVSLCGINCLAIPTTCILYIMVRKHTLLILLSAGWYSLIYNSNSWYTVFYITLFSPQIHYKTEQCWPLPYIYLRIHQNCWIICSSYENTYNIPSSKPEVAPLFHWVQSHCFLLYKHFVCWIYHCATKPHYLSLCFYPI